MELWQKDLVVNVVCLQVLNSLNYKQLGSSKGRCLKTHVLCGRFKLLVLSVGSVLKTDSLFHIYRSRHVFKHTYVSRAPMHYESLARILPSRIHEISLGDGTLGASSARACHGKPCHIYHKGDYVIPKNNNKNMVKLGQFLRKRAMLCKQI